jgi:hypothetical protein
MDLRHVYHSKNVSLCSKHLFGRLTYKLVCIGVWVQGGSKEDDTNMMGRKGEVAAGGKIKFSILWHFPDLCTWHVVSLCFP